MSSKHPIPDSYWVFPDRFLAGEYPGARNEPEMLAKLSALLDAGVTRFIDLTEEGEYSLRPYADVVQSLAAQRAVHVQHRRFSIPDMGTPAPAHLRQILDTIDAELGAGEVVYVHCFGGIGRTGTVVGCHLVRGGIPGDEALAKIAALRSDTPDGWRRSPETDAQRNLVLSWHEGMVQ